MQSGGHYVPVEIVENILLHVPAICVLTTCRSVSKAWRDIICNSPELYHYSLTGLRLLRRGNKQPTTPRITPIAFEILARFWAKLARQGIFVEPPPPPSSSKNRALRSTWRDLNRNWFTELAGQARLQLRARAYELAEQFANITLEAPFLAPSGNPDAVFEREHLLSLDITARSNWLSVISIITPATAPYKGMWTSKFKDVMIAMTNALHNNTPVMLDSSRPLALLLSLKYVDGSNVVGQDTLALEECEPFGASIPPSAHLPIELFEQILLHLPPVTLVTTCRLVSPVWKSLIEDTSRPLKHYSTTGRPLSGGASSAGTTGTVTPMASYVLGKFWKKLLEEIPRVNEAPETAPELHTDATVSDLCSCGTPLAELRRYFPQDDAILHKIVPQFEYIIPKVIHINTASTESPNPSIPSMKDRADDASATTREPHDLESYNRDLSTNTTVLNHRLKTIHIPSLPLMITPMAIDVLDIFWKHLVHITSDGKLDSLIDEPTEPQGTANPPSGPEREMLKAFKRCSILQDTIANFTPILDRTPLTTNPQLSVAFLAKTKYPYGRRICEDKLHMLRQHTQSTGPLTARFLVDVVAIALHRHISRTAVYASEFSSYDGWPTRPQINLGVRYGFADRGWGRSYLGYRYIAVPSQSPEPPTVAVPHLPLEIVEQIILNLPPATVITTCRAVSRVWKSLIETSPSLKCYSTTGLTPSQDREVYSTSILTPLATTVLSKFWQQLGSRIRTIPGSFGVTPAFITYHCLCTKGWAGAAPVRKVKQLLRKHNPFHKTVEQFESILQIPLTAGKHSGRPSKLWLISVFAKCPWLFPMEPWLHVDLERQEGERLTVRSLIDALSTILNREPPTSHASEMARLVAKTDETYHFNVLTHSPGDPKSCFLASMPNCAAMHLAFYTECECKGDEQEPVVQDNIVFLLGPDAAELPLAVWFAKEADEPLSSTYQTAPTS
ncbi:hypothetical protein Dda_4157 [Drechslerella dactyloides]|uniref:F-box domain-containing protein n=1 Tax=Drechslerella dactyloides TaxID=74499 RepID=A0AAD6NKH3_DREDA|nr:hypothetical protein Dda_4157 [Drechslerella dactyloides]